MKTSKNVHFGTMSLSEKAQRYYKDTKFKPILEFHPLKKDEEKRLEDEYFKRNNRTGYLKLYEAVRKPAGKSPTGKPMFSPTRNQVQAWLAKQLPALDYKPVQKSKTSRPILVSKIGDLVQADYLDLSDTMRDGKHRYILNMIDVLSKKAYARSPLNNTGTGPTAAQTLAVMKEMLEEYKRDYGFYPRRLHTDNGSHFLGAFEQAFADGGEFHGQIKYTSGMRYRATSQSVVERFNKTLRDSIRRYTNDPDTGSKRWHEKLPQFVANYNKNKHSSLRLAPDAADNANVQGYKDRQKEKAKLTNRNLLTLDEGDKVRLMNFKKSKGGDQYKDEPNWWPEVYTVFHVFKSTVGRAPEYALEPNPPTTLVNRPGYRGNMKAPRRKFTVYELQLLARKGDPDYDKYKVSTFARNSDTDDDDPTPAPAPAAPAQPPDVVGKQIDVKYYNSGNRSFVVNRGSIKRRKKSSGTFYEGKVLRYNQQTRRHAVKFEDATVELNLTDPAQDNYVAKGTGWRLAK
jgi:transposase InsO family protein